MNNIKTTIKKNDWGEWVVRLFVDGEHQKKADYFAADKEDATETAAAMSKEAKAAAECEELRRRVHAIKVMFQKLGRKSSGKEVQA